MLTENETLSSPRLAVRFMLSPFPVPCSLYLPYQGLDCPPLIHLVLNLWAKLKVPPVHLPALHLRDHHHLDDLRVQPFKFFPGCHPKFLACLCLEALESVENAVALYLPFQSIDVFLSALMRSTLKFNRRHAIFFTRGPPSPTKDRFGILAMTGRKKIIFQ